MHIRRGYLGWGVFLILTGAVPLAVRSGYLSDDQIGRLWTLWPLILVGVGVGLILSRTRFDFLGGIIVAAASSNAISAMNQPREELKAWSGGKAFTVAFIDCHSQNPFVLNDEVARRGWASPAFAGNRGRQR
jgi:hypothetical protein